jgi:SRSO17 transposase
MSAARDGALTRPVSRTTEAGHQRTHARRCNSSGRTPGGEANPITYPSLIDHTPRSRNLTTVGRRAYLYYTRENYKDCHENQDRDLMRAPVTFTSPDG